MINMLIRAQFSMDFEWMFCMDWSQGDKLKSITADTGSLSIMDAIFFNTHSCRHLGEGDEPNSRLIKLLSQDMVFTAHLVENSLEKEISFLLVKAQIMPFFFLQKCSV